MKRALSLLIAMCMVLGMFPVTANAEGETEYPVLVYGSEQTVSCAGADYTYVSFTPETSGTYRFYSEGNSDTVGILKDADMNQIAYNDDCSNERHGHEGRRNFCVTAELEAGVTYLLGAKIYGGGSGDVTVYAVCGHSYSLELDEQTGVLSFTCALCGDSYSLETVTLEYDEEVTVVRGDEGYPYVLFTPKTSGGYRFQIGANGDQSCDIMNMNMDLIEDIDYEYQCSNPFHGHPIGQETCEIAQLAGGTTYLLKLYCDDDVDSVAVSVGCGHSVSINSSDEEGNVDVSCSSCGLNWTTQCTPLLMNEGQEVVCTVSDYQKIFMVFTAPHTGTFHFYSTGSLDLRAYVYDSELDYEDWFGECEHESEPHTDGGNFCGYTSLREGETIVLEIGCYAKSGDTFTVYTECSHWWSRAYDPQTDLVTYTCTGCGYSYTEQCPSMEFDVETTLPCNGETESYITFTPETSGNYRFYGISTYPATNARLYDLDMNLLGESYYCREESHGHLSEDNFCITAELEAGVTYVLSVRFDATGWLSDDDATIAVSCGHNYTSEETDASCAQPGIRTYTCQVCGHTYTEEVEVPHRLVSEITVPGTCAQPGTVVHTCDVCGYAETAPYMVEHDYVIETIKEATCKANGIERVTCTACGDSFEQEVRGRHDYVEEIIPGSCTEIVVYTYTCVFCGYSYIDEDRGWYVHDFEEVVTKEPTCTESGEYIDRCTGCGVSEGPWTLDPIGHSYNEALICVNCGENAPNTWGDLTWTLVDGVLTITGEGEMPDLENHETWDGEYYIDNTPWKELAVREAVIGEGVTNVTAALFEDREELEKVTLPGTVTRIEAYAFKGCTALTTITLPDGLTEIRREAFEGSGLTGVELPDSLTYIGCFAFADCALRRIHIPAATVLDPYYGSYFDCFSGNRELELVTVDEGNPLYCCDDQGALYSKDMTELLLVPYAIEGTYVLPASVERICCEFSECAKLNAIEVEEGCEEYFSRSGMLYTCGFYDEYWDQNGNQMYAHYDNCLIACPPAKELGSYTIDAETAALADGAFGNCLDLTELTVPVTCSVNSSHFSQFSFDNYVPGCLNLKAVWFEEGHADCVSDKNGFVYNAGDWRSWIMVSCEPGEALLYVPAGWEGEYLQIPEGVTFVDTTIENPGLKAIRFPSTLKGLGSYVLRDSSVEWILFTGDQPTVSFMGDPWATNLHADLYYPDWMEGWQIGQGWGPELDEDSTYVNYIPYGKNNVPVWKGEGGEPENPFTDVPAGSFYESSVMWAVENGITNGLTANNFGPTTTCNRAQVVTFLWRAAGSPEPETTTHNFVDVQKGSFYEKPVLWAVENGITTGANATHFDPTGDCNRAQVVTFLYRAFQSPAVSTEGLPFTDVPAGAWYEAPIAWAVANNVTNGLTATTFGPTAICNRAQVVTFLYRAYNK